MTCLLSGGGVREEKHGSRARLVECIVYKAGLRLYYRLYKYGDNEVHEKNTMGSEMAAKQGHVGRCQAMQHEVRS